MAMGWFKKGAEGEKPATSPVVKTIPLSRLLSPELVLRPPSGLDKEGLVDILVRTLCARAGLQKPETFLAKVLEREKGISTTLDTGLAVPHARVDDLESICAVLALIPGGLRDPKQPDLLIRAMFLFFSPNRKEAFTQHLHLLRGVSSLFQPGFIEEILKCRDGQAAMRLITERESTH